MNIIVCLNKICLFFILFITPISLLSANDELIVVGEYIVSADLEDFDCHSSSILEISPGRLCAVWKGGPGKGKSNLDIKQNVGIWISFFHDNLWEVPQQIIEAPNSVCWSPILAKYPDGKLLLFYRIGSDPRHTVSLFKSSYDGGLTWSKEELLPAGVTGPTKTKPVTDPTGNLICGSSIEVGGPEDQIKATACWVEILSGQTWSKYGPFEIPGKKFGCIEPALFWGIDNTLKMVCRDRSFRIGSEGWIWIAESNDMGKTWSELRKTNLPNPDSGIDAINLNDNSILLVYNHSHTQRYPLSVAISQDGGESWKHLYNIEEESGEFPSVTMDSQGYVHISYAWTPPGKNQRQIKHVVILVSNYIKGDHQANSRY